VYDRSTGFGHRGIAMKIRDAVNAINKDVETAEKEKVRAGEEKIQQETAEIGNIAEVKEFTLGTLQGGLNYYVRYLHDQLISFRQSKWISSSA
jgi:hypothetical protein